MPTARPASRSWAAAGLGRTPFIAKTSSRSSPARHPELYRGDPAGLQPVRPRDNIYKARIKILVHELGIEKFAKEVDEEWRQMGDVGLTLDPRIVEEVRRLLLSALRQAAAHAGRAEAGRA